MTREEAIDLIATATAELRAENEKLKAELERLKNWI